MRVSFLSPLESQLLNQYLVRRNILFIRNMERRIEIIDSDERRRKDDIERFHSLLVKNGYNKEELKKQKRRQEERERMKVRKEEEEIENKRWYGIKSCGDGTKILKKLLKKGGVRTYRKGGKKLLDMVKRRKKKNEEIISKEEEGVVYKIKCKDCDMVYIGETGKKLMERIKQHKDDVRLRRESNAVYKHVRETGHEIDWERIEGLEREKRCIVRKWKEAEWIRKEEKENLMNWTNLLLIHNAWAKVLKDIERREKYRT